MRQVASHPENSPSAGSRLAGSTPNSLDGPPKCRHCNGNHYSKKCFKEHSYPDWFADYKACMHGPKATCTTKFYHSERLQAEKENELKNFGMEDLGRKNACENLGCTEAYERIFDGVPMTGRLEDATGCQAICEKLTGCAEGDDRSHSTMCDD
ncbi:hypothetical protein L3X38_027853 [Prunus dulcis]|uniref:Uncharacterized protein n=1 Tax=Prunus dulcis TaxID=3755 RepID=A0AAD4VQZ0_PRUDU|nr:hypothetical protein L3X38_027853 [Prunus dulcis]